MSRAPIPLDADLEAGLKRLKLSTIRSQAPDVLATAKAQRWAPEEILRNLIEAEITARDASNTRNRMTAARFPVDKTLDEFNLAESSISRASHDSASAREVLYAWLRAATNPRARRPTSRRRSAAGETTPNVSWRGWSQR